MIRNTLRNIRLFSSSSLKYTNGFDLVLNQRQLCDLECISNNSFNPVNNFLNEKDYNSVVNNNRLSDGSLWPMPVNLDINDNILNKFKNSGFDNFCLRDTEFNILGVLNVENIWKPDKVLEADKVFGGDPEHPAIKYLMGSGNYYVSGELSIYQSPIHYDYTHIRHTPGEIKNILPSDKPIVAFQTRNPMHKAHMELVGEAVKSINGHALIHPVVGLTKPGDIDYHTRIKCYQEVIKNGYMETQSGKIPSTLSLLPLAMRMGGPREALWHALIRQNYGATHFICGRDHAGPGSNSKGVDFYGAYEARDFVKSFQDELDINIISFDMMAYIENKKKYYPISKITKNDIPLKLSGTEVRNRLKTGEDIPEWFSPPAVVKILREVHPVKNKQGFTLFFTGLSGSGKSTIANGLLSKLYEISNKPITVLDGDEVRTFLSSELGFSKEHRDLNIARIAFVASEINKSRGITICAAIAPFENARKNAREIITNKGGNFIEIFVDVNLKICEERDRKGLYKKARDGVIPEFTGINSPYEIPTNPEIIIDADKMTVSESVNKIYDYLKNNNFI